MGSHCDCKRGQHGAVWRPAPGLVAELKGHRDTAVSATYSSDGTPHPHRER